MFELPTSANIVPYPFICIFKFYQISNKFVAFHCVQICFKGKIETDDILAFKLLQTIQIVNHSIDIHLMNQKVSH